MAIEKAERVSILLSTMPCSGLAIDLSISLETDDIEFPSYRVTKFSFSHLVTNTINMIRLMLHYVY